MFKKEFADVISKTGMVPLKDMRPLLLNKDPNAVSELELLNFSFFDDIRFAKQVSEKYALTFIDLSKAKINDKTIKILKRGSIIKFRAASCAKNFYVS